jgi:hypothetical protein
MQSGRWLLWSGFAVILIAIGVVALNACTLSLPGFGVVLRRCPAIAPPAISLPDRQADLLLAEYDGLLAQIARAPACPARPENLPPEIEDPPPILRGGDIAFILDTSGSMVDNKHRDPAVRLLTDIFSNPPEDGELSVWGFGTSCTVPPLMIADRNTASPGDAISRTDFDKNTNPLVTAMAGIPNMIGPEAGRSAQKPANVILIADGANGCLAKDNNVPSLLQGHPLLGREPEVCIAAGLLKRQMPYLQIHAVALTPDVEAAFQCVTDQTGGWMIPSADPDVVQAAIKHITGNSVP